MDKRRIILISGLVILLIFAVILIILSRDEDDGELLPAPQSYQQSLQESRQQQPSPGDGSTSAAAENGFKAQQEQAEQQRRKQEEQRKAAALAAEARRQAASAADKDSDKNLEWLSEEIRSLIGRRNFQKWYPNTQPLEKFLSILHAFSEGKVNHKHVAFLRPDEKFSVLINAEGQITINPQSYRRYDPLIRAVTSVRPVTVARIYRRAERRLNQLYRSLGFKNELRTTLNFAINRVLSAPVYQSPPKLIRPSVYYRFADRSIEKSSRTTRQIIRMGPDNTRKLQDWFRELQKEL